MRIANFRDDVLWAIVYLQGQDPTKNLDDDQATALVSFINAWVRRTYDAQDYPEWTRTEKFTVQPARHNVPYLVIPTDDGIDTNKQVHIGRVFKVYLRDPEKTPLRPLDTPFTLRPEGVHVGFEHGDYVWIKFIEQPPQFTSKVWNATHVYPKGELTSSPKSGHCYMSLGQQGGVNNVGQDPSRVGHILMPTELVQEHFPPTMEMPASNKILDIGLTKTRPGPDPPTTPVAGSLWNVSLSATIFSDATIVPVTHTATGSETLASIATSLAASLAAAYPAFVSISADNSDAANPVIRIEDATDFSVVGGWSTPDIGDGPTGSSELSQIMRQHYSVGSPPVARARQIVNVTLPADMVMGDSVYSLTFMSPDGKQHYVEYGALHTDGAAQILTGLANQITNSGDAWMATVQPSLDIVNSVLTLSVEDEFSMEAALAPGQVIYWKLIQFPFELIDQVVRGAYANALKEEGQTDKATIEEKVVPQEMLVSVNSNVKSTADRMTDQVGGGPQ